jgi:hypothetical protein
MFKNPTKQSVDYPISATLERGKLPEIHFGAEIADDVWDTTFSPTLRQQIELIRPMHLNKFAAEWAKQVLQQGTLKRGSKKITVEGRECVQLQFSPKRIEHPKTLKFEDVFGLLSTECPFEGCAAYASWGVMFEIGLNRLVQNAVASTVKWVMKQYPRSAVVGPGHEDFDAVFKRALVAPSVMNAAHRYQNGVFELLKDQYVANIATWNDPR